MMDKDKEDLLRLYKMDSERVGLILFAKESNEIEGIYDEEAIDDAYERLKVFMALKELTVQDVCDFNTAGELRIKEGMDVKLRVSGYVPPSGGLHIQYVLDSILGEINAGESAFLNHKSFESLHPFMDGNGRTGRAIWLWQMINQFDYNVSNGFLKEWYYQSLSNSEGR